MNDKSYTLIKITFGSNKILIQRSVTSMKDDVLEKNTIKLELSVARIFHKVLNKGRIVEILKKQITNYLATCYIRYWWPTKRSKYFS